MLVCLSINCRSLSAAGGHLFQRQSAGAVADFARKIEALLPTNLGRLAETASYWRHHIKTHLKTTAERRRFWERVFTGRFASLMLAGNKAEAEKRWKMNFGSRKSAPAKLFLSEQGRAMPDC